MTFVERADPDFRLCRLRFDELIGLQRRAEDLRWATRWTSEAALRGQLRAEEVLLMTFMREERAGSLHAIRCLVLAALAESSAGCIVTVDVEPATLPTLGTSIDDPEVRDALSRVFRLGVTGIQVVAKP